MQLKLDTDENGKFHGIVTTSNNEGGIDNRYTGNYTSASTASKATRKHYEKHIERQLNDGKIVEILIKERKTDETDTD